MTDQFERTGDLDILAEAVQICRDAVAATPSNRPDHAQVLNNLGAILRYQFERTGDLDILAEAVQVSRDAIAATPSNHADYPKHLGNLGNALGIQFERTGDLEVLAEAVQTMRDAVAATPPNHPEHPKRLSNLGTALHALFERTGDPEILAEAVQVGRDSTAATSLNHPNRAGCCSNLSGALQALYEWSGDLSVLIEAVQAARDAVSATPIDHPDRAMYLNNLGNALAIQFERTGEIAVLTEAVQVGREAVAATPLDHPDREAILSNLGATLQAYYEPTQDVDLLSEAVQIGREAVAATPLDHPNRGGNLSNLGVELRMLFERTGRLDDLTEAIQAGRDAVAATPLDHPDRASYSLDLGLALRVRFEQGGDPAVLAETKAVFAEAAASAVAQTRVRIHAGRHLGWAAMSAGNSLGAVAAYEDAIALLPQIVPRRLSRPDREHGLGEMAGLAAEAASAAIAAGRPCRAVELLEQTRGVLLGEMMDAHGDLSELHARAPTLAAQFVHLRDELDEADHLSPELLDGVHPISDAPSPWSDVEVHDLDGASGESTRRIADHRRQLAEAWDRLLSQIRSMQGFEGFMLPPPISALQRQAVEGPIVMINVSQYRCDALILTSDAAHPVRVVELPRLTRTEVIEQTNRISKAITAFHSTAVTASRSIAVTASHSTAITASHSTGRQEWKMALGWLWDQVTAPVLNNLGLNALPEPDQRRPRVWWCPVGESASLPLHAAGHHSDVDGRDRGDRRATPRAVIDCVVSSYTPTIRALQYARQSRNDSRILQAAPDDTWAGALIVAMPETPDIPDGASLPSAQKEAKRVAELLPGSLTLTGQEATHDSVLAALSHYHIAHLACHGLSDMVDPSSSRLLLYDHSTAPLTVAEISRLRLTGADLAYLSACNTTSSSPRLVDEAVHITSAFQLAGYKNVIGTLWAIGDGPSAEVADDIYTQLTDNGRSAPRIERTAYALHNALHRLRETYSIAPSLWDAYIHVGI